MRIYVNLSSNLLSSHCVSLDSSFLHYIWLLAPLWSFPVDVLKIDPFPPLLLTAWFVSLLSLTHPNVTLSPLPFLAACLLLSLLLCLLKKNNLAFPLPSRQKIQTSTISLFLSFLPEQTSAHSSSVLCAVSILTCFI